MSTALLPLLETATAFFTERQVDEPRLSAELLLAGALGLPRRLDLYVQFERPISDEELHRFRAFSRRRLAGEPVQYILGEAPFFGLLFEVGPGVLIPRPETELLVERALAILTPSGAPRILDLGTGSACIPIALCHHHPGVSACAVECSPDARTWAERNVKAHGMMDRIDIRDMDFQSLPATLGPVDLLVSNPPYIPRAELASLQIEVRSHEPTLALDGGADGLDAYRVILPQVARLVRPGGAILFEIGHDQGPALASLCAAQGLVDIRIHLDFSSHDRLAEAYLPTN